MSKIDKFSIFDKDKNIIDLISGYNIYKFIDYFTSNNKFIEIKNAKELYHRISYGFDYKIDDDSKLKVLGFFDDITPTLYLSSKKCKAKHNLDNLYYVGQLDEVGSDITAKSIDEWFYKLSKTILTKFIERINIFTAEKIEDSFLEIADDFCEYTEFILGYRPNKIFDIWHESCWSIIPTRESSKFAGGLKLYLNNFDEIGLENQFRICKNKISNDYDVNLYTHKDFHDSQYDDTVAIIVVSEK